MQNNISISIEAKMVGQKRSIASGETLSISATNLLTLKALIEMVVRHEVEEFRLRQADRQFLRVLTEADINAAKAQGKIDMGQHDPQTVDENAAIATALQGFEDGLYYVFIDDQQYETLDQHVALRDETRLTFIRLMPLAGG